MSTPPLPVVKARILLCLPAPGLAADLGPQLAGLGYALVATTTSGPEAITLAASLRPDLILLDARRAGEFDGLTTAGTLREQLALPVVLLLSTADQARLDRVLEPEPFDTLLRPFTSQELRAVIELALVKHRTTARLRAGEQQMRLQSAALEAAVNSVVITDVTGTIVWVNPAFCHITGYTQAEAIGQNPRVLKSGHQSREYYTEMWRTIASGHSWHGEFINRRKDGSLFTEDVIITPVLSDAGKVAHYIAIKQDISALKQSLAQASAARDELNAAHAELADKNRALQLALEEARAAVTAKATFLATMSHEIRTPMNGVIGMASLLRESEPLTAEQVDCIETIRSSGDLLLTLINDLLDFSKIESNHMELEQAPFDLRRCVEETLEALAPRAHDKHLELLAQLDEAVPAAIVGDAVRLRQVLSNLLGNAVKFTTQGEVVLEIRAAPAPEGKFRLFFRVRDTGIGIPPDKIGRLFKLYAQAEDSTARLYGGTGLGLAISQRLVGLMGGVITVTSAAGVGSEFAFEILTDAAPALVSPDPAALPVALTGRHALVVDDNATNRQLFAAQLGKAGMITVLTESAPAGLAWLRAHDWPDVIITDMLMPDMDGLDFALAIRALEPVGSPAVPIILVSSGGYRPSDPRCGPARLTSALSKPLRRQLLIETVARACALTPTRRAPRSTAVPSVEVMRARAQEQPCRILLAEDNAVNRKVALGMLGRIGYAAAVALDGLDAVEACRTQPFDLVLMDVQMPELDGLTAARRIRQLPGHRPTIMAMTANAMQGDREACLAAGMDGYIAKPIKLEDLQRAIAAARAR